MHAATSSARALPACTFALQADTGAWDFEQRTFTPSNCEERLITPAAGRQCLRNRTLTFAGDRHSRAATAELGLPLLDWSRMAPTDTTAACTTTGDGVHAKQWVDLIRVRLFLSYLCTGEGGRFEPPVSTRDVARRLDRTKARCVVARSVGCGMTG